MLFRPEEVHPASGIPNIVTPLPDGIGHIGRIGESLLVEELAILDDDPEGFTTVETGEIHYHGFAWEKPADRQRFQPSLTEPLLLSVNGDAVMGGDVTKRTDRRDVLGSRIRPTGDTC